MAIHSQPGGDLWIANTISDLIQGDVREHLPLKRIPLAGDVLGMGTTTSIDNGELTFLHQAEQRTAIWKCQAIDGSVRELRSGDGSGHFPYVCFSSDVSDSRVPVAVEELGQTRGRHLQDLVGEAISLTRERGALADAPIYGLRLVTRWETLIITVASKLCMGQQRRNTAIASSAASGATASRSIYELLQHYRLAAEDPGQADDPIRYLGRSLQWDCCGFWDNDPTTGRVTVPTAGANLHLHGCSTDLRFGGHLHHEHDGTCLQQLERLDLYPIQLVHRLASDLGVEALRYSEGVIQFTIANRGSMDVSDVGVAVVVDDCYSSHRYLRLPWLSAGESETFQIDLTLPPGAHRLEVIADPERHILEEAALQQNNRMAIDLVLPSC